MDEGLVLIMSFTDPLEAHLAAGKLESEGIESVLNDDAGRSLYAQAFGQTHLHVYASDVETALELLGKVTPIRR